MTGAAAALFSWEKAMADVIAIKATARPKSGKGAARTVRREGKIPGVIYGEKKEPEPIALDFNELWKLSQKGRFLSTVFEIDLGGKKSRVLPREVQFDPVKDFPIHVDFQRVGASSRVRVSVPMRFINEGASPGLKRGGVLNIVRHEVEVTCPPDRIPDFFEFDLTGLEIGRSIHISAVKMPEGVRPTILNRDFTIATIAGKKAEEEARPAEAAAAPGEEAAAPAAGAGEAKAGEAAKAGEKKK
jgi:large subunit ribosomal protein L25